MAPTFMEKLLCILGWPTTCDRDTDCIERKPNSLENVAQLISVCHFKKRLVEIDTWTSNGSLNSKIVERICFLSFFYGPHGT